MNSTFPEKLIFYRYEKIINLNFFSRFQAYEELTKSDTFKKGREASEEVMT